jgi:DNA (cytosine-5)-methyltransferase 1
MNGATLFSGIGCPELAMPWVKWIWCAEIDPFASTVHASRFPDVPNLGDVSHEAFVEKARERGSIDLLVFGSPCQSFSVAGQRGGLADPRGNLALIALRIIDSLRPRWFVFENVPGLLSSKDGRDFAAFLGAVEDIRYVGAWGVLDAQWFGVPQRRRRVFFVGHSGDWRYPIAVLSESFCLSGHPVPGRAAREDVAGTIGGGSSQRGWCDDTDRATFIPETAYALNGKGGTGRHDAQANETFVANVAAPLTGNQYADHDALHESPLAVFAQEAQTGVREYDTAGTIRADAPGTQPSRSLLRQGAIVRRLTPRECERLQGLPDDWTLIQYHGKSAKDGPRYRSIGNSMARPVLAYLGERIRRVHELG